jgi:hypothetical protein
MTTHSSITPALGSKAWADGLRKDTKLLADAIDKDYLKLAQNLWLLFDVPVDNDRKQTNWLARWGYGHIGEFAVKELGLHKRIAERLRRVWAVAGVDCKLEAEYLDRFISVGRSKARLLTRPGVMNPTNAKVWIEKAEKLTYLGLDNEVSAFLVGRADVMKGTLGKVEPLDAEGDIIEDEDELAEMPETPVLPAKTLAQTIADEVSEQVNEAAGKPVPQATPEEKPTFKSFALFKDQMDSVKAALERASQLSGSTKDGQNLSLICLDFLATSEFKTASLEQTQRFFKRIEKAMGVKVIVLEPKDHEILYGYKTLEKIQNSAVLDSDHVVVSET